MQGKLSVIVICEKCGQENKKGTTHCVNCGNELYRDYYKGLWLRNTIITLGLFLLPFIIFFYVVNSETSRYFENQVKKGLSYSIDVNTREIKSFLEERKRDLLSIANLDIINIKQIRIKDQFFRRFIRENPWFDFIAVADAKGDILFATNDLAGNISDRIYFRESLSGKFHNSGIFYSDLLDTSAMIISSPLFNPRNEEIGVILASISLKTFYNLILDLRIGETSEIFLVDEMGIFLSPSKLGGKVLREHGHYETDQNPHIGEGGILIHRDYRGEKVICAYQKFEDFHGYLVSEMDVREALAPVANLKNVMFYIFLIFGSFLVFSSIFFSKQITNLLKNLTGALKSALDDLRNKKDTINSINVELRKRLRDCESLSKQLLISEEFIKNIINSISSGLIAIDKELRITYCNDYIKNFTKDRAIQINSNLYETLPMLKTSEIKQEIGKMFSSKEPFFIRKTNVSSDGSSRILSIAGFPIRGIEDIAGATLLISDITKEEQLQAQMADYEKLASLSELALGAAHEINNPLLGITSYIEMLLEEEEDVEKKMHARQVLESAYRISETVRGLLNFARPSPPKFTKISLNKLISETLSFLKHQPLFRKIKIETLLSDVVPQITADANQIRQVIVNILLNAAQAMSEGGTVTVTSNKVKYEEVVEIRIIDTGIGISEENLKKVFDPFFTTKKGEGTGLGLSISYSYVKNHNGTITIKSKVNKGTEVLINLPIRQKTKTQSEVIE